MPSPVHSRGVAKLTDTDLLKLKMLVARNGQRWVARTLGIGTIVLDKILGGQGCTEAARDRLAVALR